MGKTGFAASCFHMNKAQTQQDWMQPQKTGKLTSPGQNLAVMRGTNTDHLDKKDLIRLP